MNKEEKIILKSQGSLEGRSTWQIGQLFLTDERLFFIQVAKQLFEVDLNRIISIRIMKRTWLLGCRVKQLCIDFHGGRGKERVYIALAQPVKWIQSIRNTMALKLIERCGHDGAKPESPNDS